MAGEPINDLLREHVRARPSWELVDLAERLHRWAA